MHALVSCNHILLLFHCESCLCFSHPLAHLFVAKVSIVSKSIINDYTFLFRLSGKQLLEKKSRKLAQVLDKKRNPSHFLVEKTMLSYTCQNR